MKVFGWPIRFAEHHKENKYLEKLRQIGDDVGDDVVEALSHHGISVDDFLNDMHSYYATDSRLATFIDSVTTKPAWFDNEECDEIIRRGTHSLTYSLTHLLTHSLTHSLKVLSDYKVS